MFKSKSHSENPRPPERGPKPAAAPERGDGAPAQPVEVEAAETIEASPEVVAFIKQLQSERDEAVEARMRALADFRNFQRRSEENEQRALQTGAMKTVK